MAILKSSIYKGHTVNLMAPKFATLYRVSGKRGESDAADAAVISEAVARPNMHFVSFGNTGLTECRQTQRPCLPPNADVAIRDSAP